MKRGPTTVVFKNPAYAKKSRTAGVVKRESLTNPKKGVSRSPEQKNIDIVAFDGYNFGSATAVLTLLNGVDDGALPLNRIGRRMTMKSLTWRFNMSMMPTTTGCSSIRNLIVYDKQANAAAPPILSVLVANAIYSNMNLSNSRRFVVLMDKVYNGIGTAGPQSIADKGYIPLNLETEFNDASTALVDSITTGSVYLIQFQDGNLLVADPLNFFYSRIRFVDT